MHCTSQDFQETVSFCSATKDCGFSKLPDYLNGVLDCDIKKANNKFGITCQLNVDCGQEKHVCVTPKQCHWNPNLEFKDIENARCVLHHDVSHCIKMNPKWNLTEHLNCTIKPADHGSSEERSNTNQPIQCDDKTGETGTGYITSIVFNVVLVILLILAGVWIWHCKKQRDSGNSPAQGPA
ncbi:hypothetical protein NFI96_025931, partial [Prochilodus magdalenae]